MKSIIWIVIVIVLVAAGYYLFMADTPASEPVQPDGEAATNNNSNLEASVAPVEVAGETGEDTSMETTPESSELIKEDITVGTGAQANVGDKVKVHYVGTLTNGTKFDASADHGGPAEFKLEPGSLIQGWVDGVAGMKVGGKRKLTIPPVLAYGSQELPGIPANSTLLFEIELLEVNGQK